MKNSLSIAIAVMLLSGLMGCSERAKTAAHDVAEPPAIGGVEVAKKDAQALFTIVNVFDFGRHRVRNFTFCPATRRLYVSFTDKLDNLLYEWDVDKGEVLHKYDFGEEYMPDSVIVSHSGSHLVVGCWPLDFSRLQQCKTVIVDIAHGRQIQTLSLTDRTFWPEFSTDGSMFWVDDRGRGRKAFDLAGRPLTGVRYKKPEPQNQSAWRIESAKDTIETHGLYYRDADGKDHHLTQNEWHDNYCVTKDKRFIVATTWDGELLVWRTDDCEEIFRQKLSSQYGYLAYDSETNRVLLGDAKHDGTTFLRALVIEKR